MIDGHLFTVNSGMTGFDTNEKLNAARAQALHRAGMNFAVRYLHRGPINAHDLDAAEAEAILASGLGLMTVQHVESEESWEPSAAKGYQYGQAAVEHARACGLPPGTMIWLDLEGVEAGIAPSVVAEYCNIWHVQVAAAGYLPGLYVGWHCGLTPKQLYNDLRFTHYWAAYNLNSDEYPVVRGVQLRQREANPLAGVNMQLDGTSIDRLGGAPVILARWSA